MSAVTTPSITSWWTRKTFPRSHRTPDRWGRSYRKTSRFDKVTKLLCFYTLYEGMKSRNKLVQNRDEEVRKRRWSNVHGLDQYYYIFARVCAINAFHRCSPDSRSEWSWSPMWTFSMEAVSVFSGCPWISLHDEVDLLMWIVSPGCSRLNCIGLSGSCFSALGRILNQIRKFSWRHLSITIVTWYWDVYTYHLSSEYNEGRQRYYNEI